ncbi:histidine phosphatase family protein [Pseudolysinimonas sp.]|uniref:histidine phosphatase family protein n=1 Tax=Pseudolysinimonas sp. TaxID=2680009 RepID=UPI003F7D23AA
MRLLLVRHGQTPANVVGALDTAPPGPGLTALGEQQAAAVPHALRGESIDGVYASILLRTQLTSRPLTAALGLPDAAVLPGLHEIEAADLEDRRDRDAVRSYLEVAWAWGSGDLSPRMPGGTDGNAFFARYDADIRAIAAAHAGGTAVAFSHGAAIRVWCAVRAGNLPPDYAAFSSLDNTGVVILDGDPDGGWIVESWAGQPVGGMELRDPRADDVTGESIEDVR